MKEYKERIKSKGLKSSWIAKQLGIPPSTLSCYLSGIRTMPLNVEAKLKMLLK